MSIASDPAEIQLQQTLDRLNITPQQLLDYHHSLADRRSSPPERLGSRIRGPDSYEPGRDDRLGSRIPGLLDKATGGMRWRFNVDKLLANLNQELEPRGVGFCYMLNRRGKPPLSHRSGEARVTVPPIPLLSWAGEPGLAWDIDVPANLASVSKLITAIATVLLLEEYQVPLGSPVVNYLPGYWKPHWNNGTISFHELLRHESGLGWIETDSGFGNFKAAKRSMELASSGNGPGMFSYKNLNYTLLRISFPIVAEILPRDLAPPGAEDSLWDQASTQVYRDFCNQRIFAPAGVGPFDFKAPPDSARAYGTPPLPFGSQIEDVTPDAGASGWQLTLEELMKVVAEFRWGGSIRTPKQAQQLLENLYGINDVFPCNAGAIYAKRGRYNDQGNTLDTAIYFLPDEMELGLFINSGPGSGVSQTSYNDGIDERIAASVEPY